MGSSLSRRQLIQAGGAVAAAAVPVFARAQPPGNSDPRPTKRQLLERGAPEVYADDELKFIGMPVGGLFSGTVYLGGDGQLWNWDIFNQGQFGCVVRPNAVFMGDTLNAGGGANYVDPVRQQSPFEQKFSLLVIEAAPRVVRFGDVKFRGEYPVVKVKYSEADADLEMTLEAFSPFCPHDVENSSFPATTLTFRVKNVGKSPLACRLKYETDNPVLLYSRKKRDDFELRGTATATQGAILTAAKKPSTAPPRTDILFEDWSSGTYGKWVATGTAFGDKPRRVKELPSYMGDVEAGAEYVVNTHQTRNGENIEAADAHQGTLTSPQFVIDRKFIELRVGGGSHAGQTCVNLLVNGAIVRSVTGHDSNAMRWDTMDVREWAGKPANLQVVDHFSGPWGNISLGEVIFVDEPRNSAVLETLPDFGSFSVEFVGGAGHAKVSSNHAEVGKDITMNPGEEKEVTLVVSWHFPNCFGGLPGKRNHYAQRWRDAAEVGQELIKRWPTLQAATRLWNKTWYDSTVPYWFLDRTFVNTSILATTTCHRLDDGRYYFWEGVGCCAGTCTHVWGYAQAIGRVFPEIERYLRKAIDFGIAYHKETGAIDYRAEHGQVVAHDGQASCILRAYREHLMSKSNAFLASIWPEVKGAMACLMTQDKDKTGILEGPQYNTLDTAWYGEIAWISSLYIAALQASSRMATEMNDQAFAAECRQIAERGSVRLANELFNGEYFVNHADPAHPEANNTRSGCHIDQLYGQSWAHQVGLGRIVDAGKARAALRSLYQHNFYEDVWEYRRTHRLIPGGRWYAAPKESGLIMCSFPKGDALESIGKGGDAWAVGYFNECMSGFEYQAASHMIAEGLIEEGLRVVRAIHDRYHASKRNPYNEVECSDHYGRAMASFGAFITLCGFTSHGPSGKVALTGPALGKSFRVPFLDANGWGTAERKNGGPVTFTYLFRNSA